MTLRPHLGRNSEHGLHAPHAHILLPYLKIQQITTFVFYKKHSPFTQSLKFLII